MKSFLLALVLSPFAYLLLVYVWVKVRSDFDRFAVRNLKKSGFFNKGRAQLLLHFHFSSAKHARLFLQSTYPEYSDEDLEVAFTGVSCRVPIIVGANCLELKLKRLRLLRIARRYGGRFYGAG